jgi:hypothetical protein
MSTGRWAEVSVVCSASDSNNLTKWRITSGSKLTVTNAALTPKLYYLLHR